jgi:thioredoxin-dependent peroxiredoxin
MLKEGQKAPSFSSIDQNGNTIALKDYKGKNVVLYFYPKDDTPGCTKQACNFRDELPSFKNLDAVILGVSADSSKSHKQFSGKYNLPFTLVADEDKKLIEDYGVWKQKSMFGKKYMGIERTTFIIDREGVIRKIFPKVKVNKHNREVMDVLKELSKE